MRASEFYEYLYGEKPPKNFTNSSSIHIFGFAEAYIEYLNQGQTLPIDSVVVPKGTLPDDKQKCNCSNAKDRLDCGFECYNK